MTILIKNTIDDARQLQQFFKECGRDWYPLTVYEAVYEALSNMDGEEYIDVDPIAVTSDIECTDLRDYSVDIGLDINSVTDEDYFIEICETYCDMNDTMYLGSDFDEKTVYYW